MEVAREITAFCSAQIRQDLLLIPHSLHASLLLSLIRTTFAHLHQEGLVDTRLLSHGFLTVLGLFARAFAFAFALEDIDRLSVEKLRR